MFCHQPAATFIGAVALSPQATAANSVTCPKSGGCTPNSRCSTNSSISAGSGACPTQPRGPQCAATSSGLGLAERAKDDVEKLSLGNQQRVQIIAALMGEPQALVLDEPFSGLDPAAVDNMADLLREHTTKGVPVLFSSHQLDLVERLCESLVILAGGKVVGRGHRMN